MNSNSPENKKSTTLITVTILVVVVAIIGAFLFYQNTNQNQSANGNLALTKTTEVTVEVENSEASQSSQDSSSDVESTNSSLNESSASTITVNVESGYASYSQDKLVNAEYGRVILFFHANWCPSCRALDTNIRANLTNIPTDVLILKLDYDTNSDLKSKYNVTSQHTLVQVDEAGNLIKSSPGLYQLNTLDSVLNAF